MVKAVDINGKYHDVSIDDVSWRIHVYAIIVDDGKLLLSPQHREGAYDLPGGKVELDENLEDGLVREVQEETGIGVRPMRLLTMRDNFFKVTFREPQETCHSVMMYYVCEKVGGEISTEGFDENEKSYARMAEWVPIDQLADIMPAASFDWRTLVEQVLHD